MAKSPYPVVFITPAERDKWIKDNAIYYTAVRFLGVGRYNRHEDTDLGVLRKKVLRLVKGGGIRYLIYAVTAEGHDTYLETIGDKEKHVCQEAKPTKTTTKPRAQPQKSTTISRTR